MSKIVCVETRNIKHPEIIVNAIYNNFIYLTEFPELQHTKNDIMKLLQLDDKLCYLLYLNNSIIGYLIGDYRTFPDNRYGFYVSYLYIAKKYRKHGLGKMLMNKIINKCRNQGTKFIILTCDTNDTNIVNFYNKLGFKIDRSLGSNKRHNVFSLQF